MPRPGQYPDGFPSAAYSRWYRGTSVPGGGFGPRDGDSGGDRVDEALDEYDELGETPEARQMSLAMLRRYALGEMDIGARAAALQAGAASQRLGGMNPAQRTMALSEISRGGAGMVGQGVGQAAALAQQSNLASYQGAMQNRMMLGNAIQQALGQGYAMEQIRLQGQQAMDLARLRASLQRRNQRKSGGFWGALGSIAGTVLGGPIGGYIGGAIFGSGQGNNRYAS